MSLALKFLWSALDLTVNINFVLSDSSESQSTVVMEFPVENNALHGLFNLYILIPHNYFDGIVLWSFVFISLFSILNI